MAQASIRDKLVTHAQPVYGDKRESYPDEKSVGNFTSYSFAAAEQSVGKFTGYSSAAREMTGLAVQKSSNGMLSSPGELDPRVLPHWSSPGPSAASEMTGAVKKPSNGMLSCPGELDSRLLPSWLSPAPADTASKPLVELSADAIDEVSLAKQRLEVAPFAKAQVNQSTKEALALFKFLVTLENIFHGLQFKEKGSHEEGLNQVRKLLQLGEDPNQKYKDGFIVPGQKEEVTTAGEIALFCYHIRVVELLLIYGLMPFERNKNGELFSPLLMKGRAQWLATRDSRLKESLELVAHSFIHPARTRVKPLQLKSKCFLNKGIVFTQIQLQDGRIVFTELKKASALTATEKEFLDQLYKKGFKGRADSSMTKDLASSDRQQKYIDIVYDDKRKMIGFQIIGLITLKRTPNYLVGHGVSSYLEPEFRSSFLCYIAYRFPFALSHLFPRHQIGLYYSASSINTFKGPASKVTNFAKYIPNPSDRAVIDETLEIIYEKPNALVQSENGLCTIPEEVAVVTQLKSKTANDYLFNLHYSILGGTIPYMAIPTFARPSIELSNVLSTEIGTSFSELVTEFSDQLYELMFLEPPAQKNKCPGYVRSAQAFFNKDEQRVAPVDSVTPVTAVPLKAKLG